MQTDRKQSQHSEELPGGDEVDSPFRIDLSFKSPLKRRLLTPSARLLGRFMMFHHLDELYRNALKMEGGGGFFNKLLRAMNVTCEVADADLARVPTSGPAIVVANHPYGGIEAIMMLEMLKRIRPDSKILANHLLSRIVEVREYCIFVDVFGSDKSRRMNVGPVKEAVKWVKNGGLLAVFPAGEVSHMSLRSMGVVDGPWSTGVGRIMRLTEAPVLPAFIAGHNGLLFQLAGLIHPRLRTALLPRELLNKRNRSIKISIGNLIPYEKLDAYSSDTDLMEYLRFRSYILEHKNRKPKPAPRRLPLSRLRRRVEPVAPPEDPDLMAAELEHLPDEQKLSASGNMEVYVARAYQIRHVLHEIGRLREVTFRKEHEGTGKSTDLDRFDENYWHLFMWNKAAKDVVGAYRMGPTDEILARFGKKGLYTSTLFRYRKSVLERISPALELGRSFIRPEYQKNYSSLLLLWKGIGVFCVRNPRYKNLIGPVSISNEYHSVSRLLLAAFLRVNNYQAELAKMIKPKHPLRVRPIKACAPTIFSSAIRDIDTISSVISEIESDQKGAPILLKQYLRMGAKLLAFNRDPDFCDVLDGLMLADLAQTDHKQLMRFMGKEGMRSFLAYHGVAVAEEAGRDTGGEE